MVECRPSRWSRFVSTARKTLKSQYFGFVRQCAILDTKGIEMNREDIVLAGLAAGGPGASFPPAQVQKLFFLIDKEAAPKIGGPFFDFRPYDYGPFDSTLYSALDLLEAEGKVTVNRLMRYRRYSLSDQGMTVGKEKLLRLPQPAQCFFIEAARWVGSQSFEQLVSAIYAKYPEMKVNSIFRS